MSRDQSRRYIPFCPTRIPPVDQYMMPEVDTTERTCQNGVSHPIYSCKGEISRTLPLTFYPEVNSIHPQIYQSSQPHFGTRDPIMMRTLEQEQLLLSQGRIEGLYVGGSGEYDPYKARAQKLAKRLNGYSN